MNIVLLSGGSGKRLWPLSNDTQSKQFLKLLKNERGEYESMVQRVIRQIRVTQPRADISVACNSNQIDILNRQAGGVDIIAEPCRRNTFPAIVLASAYLHYKKEISEDEVFVVCPIDTFAHDDYYDLLTDVAEQVNSGRFALGLMGAVPTFPTEKYGYILCKRNEVTGFVEKPSESRASQLINEGALWNCGVFALKIGYILSHARAYVEFDDYEGLLEQYESLPKISFDYEVCEKEKSIGCTVYDGVWKDLGTWNTLAEELPDASLGSDVLISESCKNTHVLNMLNIPMIANEINDAIIVASHDGILVSGKHGSSFLKPLAEQINLRPMYEQRGWGNYRVLEYKQSTDGNSTLIKRVHIEAGKTISFQNKNTHSKMWMIAGGKGILTVDDVDSAVSPGNMIAIDRDTGYALLAATDIELIEVRLGKGEIDEDDED